MNLNKHHIEAMKKMLAILSCFMIMFYTFSSNFSLLVNAEGNTLDNTTDFIVDYYGKVESSGGEFSQSLAGGNFCVIKQGSGHVIVWSEDELNTGQQAEIERVVRQNDKSVEGAAFHFVVENEIDGPSITGQSNWGTYSITYIDGNYVFTCDGDKISHLDYGKYTQTTEEQGSLKIVKSVVGKENGIYNFTVTDENGKETPVKIDTSMQNSEVITGLEPGEYTVAEVNPEVPNGYSLKVTVGEKELKAEKGNYSTKIFVAAGQTATVSFVNIYEKQSESGSLIIKKVDADDKEKVLAGAEFTLTKDDYKEMVTTDKDGMATFTGLEYGKYKLTETKAPEGYRGLEESKEVIISENGIEMVTIENTKLAQTEEFGSLIITKVDSETGEPVAGTEFTLYDIDGNSIKTKFTDEKGIVSFTELSYGKYTVQETDAAEGYVLSKDASGTFEISKASQTVTYEFENTPEQPNLLVEKTADKSQYLPGETVTYTINVTNDGNVDLEDVTLEDIFYKNGEVVDEQLTIEDYDGPFDLAIGETATFTSTYVVPENDLADTVYTNHVTVTTGDTTGEDEVDVVIDPTYALTIDKTVNKETAEVGDTVTYTIKVTNTGNKAIENVSVVDEMVNLDEVIGHLAPNESETFTVDYKVTADDVGELVNVAVATAKVDDHTITAEGKATMTVSEPVAPVKPEEPKTPVEKVQQKVHKVYTWVTSPKTGEKITGIILAAVVFVAAGLGIVLYRRKLKH